jgi:3-oxoadipate enol-lactonase
MERRFISIHGRSTSYTLTGQEDAPRLLLSHALATRLEIWGYQIPLLSAYFRVVLYDVRGHGESETLSDRCTLAELADDVAALLDHLSIDEVGFVGLSLGGMIGQVFALRHPERASALVLCSTGSSTSSEGRETLEKRIQTTGSAGMEAHVDPTLERWFTKSYRESSPEILHWVGSMVRATSPEGYIGCSRAIQALDTRSDLPHLKIPVLLLAGEHDAAFPPSACEKMQLSIPGSRLETVPEAAHLGNIEKAHIFNEHLCRFLRKTLL